MASDAVRIKGKELRCSHCGQNRFVHQQVEVDRALGGAWVWFELWSKLADVYVCGSCGFVHWFFGIRDAAHEVRDVGQEAETVEPAEPTECLSCGQMIPAGVEKCVACGWSWVEATPL